MAARHPPRRPNPESPARPSLQAARWDQRLEQLATGIALLLLVVRPLFPSEDADAGTGLLVVALWGLVAVLWATAQAWRDRFCLYATSFDIGPLVILAIVLISVARCDALRPGINMASEWAGLIIAYFLVRQLFRSPNAQRLLLTTMIAVAVTIAIYGLYQAFWGLDLMRAEYSVDRMKILRDLDITPDSMEEEAFKNRLNSHEPFSTFALANSLAGFLVVWLPIALVWSFQGFLHGPVEEVPSEVRAGGQRAFSVFHAALGSTMVLAISICLILTQSRTAYVALIVELILLSALFGRTLFVRLRKAIGRTKLVFAAVGSVALIAMIIVIAWRRGKIDEMVITQSAKSLNYRVEYWRATIQMIASQPWQGTGPGNFRSHYLRYKLPQSSEEIADPHNMVLELSATSGVPAGAAWVGFLAVAIARMLIRPRVAALRSDSSFSVGLWFSGIGGFIVAALLWAGPKPELFISLLALWCGSAAALCWVPLQQIDSRVIAIAILGVSIHLLGAGGISMPGVSQSIWVLLALGVSVTDGPLAPYQCQGARWSRLIVLSIVGVWAAFVCLVLRPVVLSTSSVALGRNLLATRDLGGAETRFRMAADEDPLSVEPWLELSRIHYERWATGRGPLADEQFELAVAALQHAERLVPTRLEPVRRLAQLYEVQAEQHNAFWAKAAERYRRCLDLYPNNAELCVRLARALWEARQPDAAKEMAARALQLDAETPHADRKLTDDERRLLEPLHADKSPVE